MWNPQWTWGGLLIFYLEYSKPWEGRVKQFLKDRHLWPALGWPRSDLLISFVEDGQAGWLIDFFVGSAGRACGLLILYLEEWAPAGDLLIFYLELQKNQ